MFLKRKDEKILSFSLTVIIQGLFLSNIFGSIEINTSALLKIIAAAMLVVSSGAIIRRFKYSFLFVVFASILLLLINMWVFPRNTRYLMGPASYFFTICFPLAILFCSICDYDLFYSYMKKGAIFCSVVAFVYFILIVFADLDYDSSKYMTISYAALIPWCTLLISSFEKDGKITAIILQAPFILLILILGCRGALLVAAISWMVLLLKKNMTSRKVGTVLVVGIVTISFLFSYQRIARTLYEFFQTSFGIASRSLRYISQGDLHLAPRLIGYNMAIDAINDNFIFGAGLAADYRLLGTYTHNLELQLLLEFGFFFGSILLLFIFIKAILHICRGSASSYGDVFVILFIVNSLIQLQVTSSIWLSYAFWMWFLYPVKKKSMHKNDIISCE